MKYTDKDRFKLRCRVIKEIKRIKSQLKEKNEMEEVERFKEKFMLCERAYKIVLGEYKEVKDGEVIKEGRLKITMKQVPGALEFAGYKFKKEMLSRLFSGEDHRGIKSAKKLRDALTHKLSENDVEELMKRKKQLYKDMDNFIELIESYDEMVS